VLQRRQRAIYYQDFGLSSVACGRGRVYGPGRDFGMTSEPTKAVKAVAVERKWHISYGGRQDLQYVDDVAKISSAAWRRPNQGAKSYNLRGEVVEPAGVREVPWWRPSRRRRNWSRTATSRSPSPST